MMVDGLEENTVFVGGALHVQNFSAMKLFRPRAHVPAVVVLGVFKLVSCLRGHDGGRGVVLLVIS